MNVSNLQRVARNQCYERIKRRHPLGAENPPDDIIDLFWLSVEAKGRKITLLFNADILAEISRLDGCYVITTDLPAEAVATQQAHAYYKDLSKVERAFRESKTGHLELRPVHVRKEKSTRGHVCHRPGDAGHRLRLLGARRRGDRNYRTGR